MATQDVSVSGTTPQTVSSSDYSVQNSISYKAFFTSGDPNVLLDSEESACEPLTVVRACSFTQGGWGAKPSGNNPGKLLSLNFANVYPSGVTVGGNPAGLPGGSGPYTMQFTSASAIQAYLATGTTPGRLTANLVNPSTRTNPPGVFGGQVLALRLNVDFSSLGLLAPPYTAVTSPPLGGIVYTGTACGLGGQTVAQILDFANSILGGATLPGGCGANVGAVINPLITSINQNFDKCNLQQGAGPFSAP